MSVVAVMISSFMGQIGLSFVFELNLHQLKKENNNVQCRSLEGHTPFSVIRENPVIKAFHCMHRPEPIFINVILTWLQEKKNNL